MVADRRKTLNWLIVIAGTMSAPAFADSNTAPAGAPFSVRQNQAQIVDYCTLENLPPGACSPGTFWEVKGSCPAPAKVAAVSCALDDFDGGPRLISNGMSANRATGSCVWQFTNLKQSDAPTGTVTLLCTQQ